MANSGPVQRESTETKGTADGKPDDQAKPSADKIPRIPKAEDISNLFDRQRENMENRGSTFGKGGSLGFGFRGTIPKLPSFKVSQLEIKDFHENGNKNV